MANPTWSLLACALCLTGAGCGGLPREPAVIPPERASKAVGAALDLRLEKAPDPDSASLANLAGSYTGSDRRRRALVLVFDSPGATDQVTGGKRRRVLAGATTVVERNVVVFYRGPDAGLRRLGVSSALREALPDG